jgi:cysteine peptidase C11 family protein
VTTADWNVLLYAIAENAEELARVTHAITDMHAALTSEQCNVAVQLHSRSRTTRHWISAGRKVRTEVLPVSVDASEPSSLTSFMNTAHRASPARSTALMMWAHSSGLDYVHDYAQKKPGPPPGLKAVFGEQSSFGLGGGVEGVFDTEPTHGGDPAQGHGVRAPARGRPERYGCRWGPDPTTKQYLTNVGMKKAIAASTRRRVEVLGLNACWMASLEVEYELRGVSDVQIASQVYAQPWPYGAIVGSLSVDPEQTAEQLARTIVGAVRSEISASKRTDAVSALR